MIRLLQKPTSGIESSLQAGQLCTPACSRQVSDSEPSQVSPSHQAVYSRKREPQTRLSLAPRPMPLQPARVELRLRALPSVRTGRSEPMRQATGAGQRLLEFSVNDSSNQHHVWSVVPRSCVIRYLLFGHRLLPLCGTP